LSKIIRLGVAGAIFGSSLFICKPVYPDFYRFNDAIKHTPSYQTIREKKLEPDDIEYKIRWGDAVEELDNAVFRLVKKGEIKDKTPTPIGYDEEPPKDEQGNLEKDVTGIIINYLDEYVAERKENKD